MYDPHKISQSEFDCFTIEFSALNSEVKAASHRLNGHKTDFHHFFIGAGITAYFICSIFF